MGLSLKKSNLLVYLLRLCGLLSPKAKACSSEFRPISRSPLFGNGGTYGIPIQNESNQEEERGFLPFQKNGFPPRQIDENFNPIPAAFQSIFGFRTSSLGFGICKGPLFISKNHFA
jgi:hypothetical protein